jgi:hypothetical protein
MSACLVASFAACQTIFSVIVQAIKGVFEAVQPAGLKIATEAVPLSDVEDVCDKATGKPRVVFTLG